MKSKIIAITVFLVIFLVPFRMLFITDEVVHGSKFIALFFANLIGFFVAFGIGTNEPFDKKKENKPAAEESAKPGMRQAA